MSGKHLYSLSVATNDRVVKPALKAALDHHVPAGAPLTIFLADRIQVFNQIARGEHEVSGFAWSGDERTDLAKKRDLIAAVRKGQAIDPTWSWDFISIDDLQGPKLAGIYRAVRILYDLDPRFSKDVDDCCAAYVDGKRDKLADKALALAMGRLFVLEEIAINIHLRCVSGYADEFYTGLLPPAMLNLYTDRYAKDAWFLASAPRAPVRFHEWDGSAWTTQSF